jgi:hypothetical protein
MLKYHFKWNFFTSTGISTIADEFLINTRLIEVANIVKKNEACFENKNKQFL